MPATLLKLEEGTLNPEVGPLNLEEGPPKLGKGLINRQDRVRSAQLRLSGSQSGRSRYVGLLTDPANRVGVLLRGRVEWVDPSPTDWQ